jgi:hypothetical protein
MKRKVIFILAIVGFFLNACYTSKKATRPINITVSDFEVVIEKDPKGHFVDNYTKEQYKEFFMTQLKSSLEYNNIFIKPDNAEFSVTIDKVLLKETLTVDTIKDAQSPDFGKVFDITMMLVKSTGTVTSNRDGKKWEAFTADKSDKEKLTLQHPIGTKIDGRKPGPHDWRKKGFNSHECRDHTLTVGKRTSDVITNRVNRFIK